MIKVATENIIKFTYWGSCSTPHKSKSTQRVGMASVERGHIRELVDSRNRQHFRPNAHATY